MERGKMEYKDFIVFLPKYKMIVVGWLEAGKF
jgi:hypothetical protein